MRSAPIGGDASSRQTRRRELADHRSHHRLRADGADVVDRAAPARARAARAGAPAAPGSRRSAMLRRGARRGCRIWASAAPIAYPLHRRAAARSRRAATRRSRSPCSANARRRRVDRLVRRRCAPVRPRLRCVTEPGETARAVVGHVARSRPRSSHRRPAPTRSPARPAPCRRAAARRDASAGAPPTDDGILDAEPDARTRCGTGGSGSPDGPTHDRSVGGRRAGNARGPMTAAGAARAPLRQTPAARGR